MQRSDNDQAALGLEEHLIYMAPDGAMRSYAKSGELFRKGTSMAGRVLALQHVNGPADVHYPAWEMHPEGDELLILASGSLSVELRSGETAPLSPQTAFIVPTGTWHRLIVHEPSVLLAITPRRNTVHEKD